MSNDPSHQVNLLDLLAFLIRWRRFLISAVLVVAGSVAIFAFVAHPRFRSTAVIRSHESSGAGIGALIASKLGSLGGLASFAPSFGEVPEETFVTILKSRWMSDRVIEHFDLRKVYGMQGESDLAVVKMLLGNTSFQLNPKTMHVIMYAEDRDPQLAKDIVDFYIDELDRRNQDLKSFAAKREREFIAGRLDLEQKRLTALEDSLSLLQLTTGVVNVEEQIKATIQASAGLEAKRLAAQTELTLKSRLYDPAGPEASYLRAEIASIDSTLQSLISARGANDPNDFLLHLGDASVAGLQYLRLTRDIEIQQLLVAYLLQQFEQAKIDEVRNTPTLMRIDPPVVENTKVWPRRGLMVVVAALASFVFALTLAMLIEFWRSASSDPSHPSHAKIMNLRQSWKVK